MLKTKFANTEHFLRADSTSGKEKEFFLFYHRPGSIPTASLTGTALGFFAHPLPKMAIFVVICLDPLI